MYYKRWVAPLLAACVIFYSLGAANNLPFRLLFDCETPMLSG